MITSFEQIYEILRSKTRKRLIAAWAVDDHTITAAYKAVELGIVDATLVGDVNMIKKVCEAEKIDPSVFTIINNENELASIAQAVLMVREGQGEGTASSQGRPQPRMRAGQPQLPQAHRPR